MALGAAPPSFLTFGVLFWAHLIEASGAVCVRSCSLIRPPHQLSLWSFSKVCNGVIGDSLPGDDHKGWLTALEQVRRMRAPRCFQDQVVHSVLPHRTRPVEDEGEGRFPHADSNSWGSDESQRHRKQRTGPTVRRNKKDMRSTPYSVASIEHKVASKGHKVELGAGFGGVRGPRLSGMHANHAHGKLA